LIATGSEVHIAMEAAKILKAQGVTSRVVSMPSWEIFEAQSAEYKHSVLPPNIKARISIEAGLTFGWCRYTGDVGVNIGIDHFGASAPSKTLYEQFGINAAKVVEAAIKMLK
jgi:transketolase